MNQLPPINLKEDAWKWEVFDVMNGSFNGRPHLLFEGECQSYSACLMAFKLLGVEHRKMKNDFNRIYYGDRQVYIQFTRLSDGVRMTEWGSKEFKFPP